MALGWSPGARPARSRRSADASAATAASRPDSPRRSFIISDACRCIPVRCTPDHARPDSVRVLLISSSNGSGWVFPKGGWELDESAKEAARRETVEEGGVRGDLEEPQLGVYPYSNRKPGSQRKGCIAHVFVMNVQEELAVWPEAAHRTRRWVRLLTSGSHNFKRVTACLCWHRCPHCLSQPFCQAQQHCSCQPVPHKGGCQSMACGPCARAARRVQVTIEEASRECRHPWMRSALHDWVRLRGWTALADRLDAAAPAS